MIGCKEIGSDQFEIAASVVWVLQVLAVGGGPPSSTSSESHLPSERTSR